RMARHVEKALAEGVAEGLEAREVDHPLRVLFEEVGLQPAHHPPEADEGHRRDGEPLEAPAGPGEKEPAADAAGVEDRRLLAHEEDGEGEVGLPASTDLEAVQREEEAEGNGRELVKVEVDEALGSDGEEVGHRDAED